MAILPPCAEEVADIQARLHELQMEHRDLDQVIAHLESDPPADELLIRRMKKRKLLLKDRIAIIQHMMDPDVPA